jgi:hypothetical protein
MIPQFEFKNFNFGPNWTKSQKVGQKRKKKTEKEKSGRSVIFD